MKSHLTPTEQELLIVAIREVNTNQPALTNREKFEAALKNLQLDGKLQATPSNANRWLEKAFPKPNNGVISTDDVSQMPPEQAISYYERKIREQLQLLEQRRNIKMQEVTHIDDVMAKYKVPRGSVPVD